MILNFGIPFLYAELEYFPLDDDMLKGQKNVYKSSIIDTQTGMCTQCIV